jgi:activator of HSP90 ATPase
MKTLIQKIKFKAAPKTLFEMYMDSKKHSLATGGKAVMSRKAGGSYSAHGGYIKGKNLMIVPNEMIVQTWRGSDWKKNDMDSTFILAFEKEGSGTLVTMVHANLPDRHAGHLNQGWKDHYWKPWRAYLKNPQVQ